MTKYWHKLLLKLLFWLTVEVILNAVGLDNLADYSEFLLDHAQAAGRETISQQIQFPLKATYITQWT